jgi:hypothetical protein
MLSHACLHGQQEPALFADRCLRTEDAGLDVLFRRTGGERLARKYADSGRLSTGAAFAVALRDILIASISKGQFPMVLCATVVLVIVLRMPPEDVSGLAFRILDAAERRAIGGYVLAAILLVAWIIHARYQRKQFRIEFDRISSERNDAQARVLGNRVQSSEAEI